MEYVTIEYCCSECGEVYRSKKAALVFKEGDRDFRKRILAKYGCIKSHGYCPDCHKEVMAKLKLMKRKQINIKV